MRGRGLSGLRGLAVADVFNFSGVLGVSGADPAVGAAAQAVFEFIGRRHFFGFYRAHSFTAVRAAESG